MHIRIAKISILFAYISTSALLLSTMFSRKAFIISGTSLLFFMIIICICGTIEMFGSAAIMKLLKGIFAAIIVACFIFIFIVGMMFEVDTVTLLKAIKMVLIFFGIAVVSFICYISIDIRERNKEDWQDLLDRERKGLR